jgi:hypothetical protein
MIRYLIRNEGDAFALSTVEDLGESASEEFLGDFDERAKAVAAAVGHAAGEAFLLKAEADE